MGDRECVLRDVIAALSEPIKCPQPSNADVAAAVAWLGAARFIEQKFLNAPSSESQR